MKTHSSTAISFSVRVLLLYVVLVMPLLQSTPLYAGIAFKGIEKNISDPEKLESFLEPKLSDFLLKKNPKSESVLILLSLRKQ